jgi:hypothetical protein
MQRRLEEQMQTQQPPRLAQTSQQKRIKRRMRTRMQQTRTHLPQLASSAKKRRKSRLPSYEK